MRFNPTACAVLLLFAAAGRAHSQEHEHHTGAAAERLGTLHFQTSCSASVAPRFDRAVALLHSFEFGASIKAFSEVASSDSTCAMAHWGIALSRWSNPTSPTSRQPAQLEMGRAAVAAALRASTSTTERERGYIDAVGKLYADYEHVDQRSRILAYERAMADLVEKQPADTEAKIFYAIALIASAPPTDKSYAGCRSSRRAST